MKKMKPINLTARQHVVEETLLKQARKNKDIVYGSQAIKRRLGINARPPSGDYDFYSKAPRKSSFKAQRNLDKSFKGDYFYDKKGVNPGTWKVKYIGKDLRKGTKDDVGIADYTKTPRPPPKTFKFRKVRYRVLKEELKAKQKLVNDPSYKYRREKDLKDLNKIKKYGRKYLK